MSKETQQNRMIKEMKKRKVKNWEFPSMGILSYSRRIFEIKQRGFTVSMERIYKDGEATGTFVYWIPRKRKKLGHVVDGMAYEEY